MKLLPKTEKGEVIQLKGKFFVELVNLMQFQSVFATLYLVYCILIAFSINFKSIFLM